MFVSLFAFVVDSTHKDSNHIRREKISIEFRFCLLYIYM